MEFKIPRRIQNSFLLMVNLSTTSIHLKAVNPQPAFLNGGYCITVISDLHQPRRIKSAFFDP